MTKQELNALRPGTKVRLVATPEAVGTFRSLNWAGLACVDGDPDFWMCARICDEIEVARDEDYAARPRPRLSAGTHAYRGRRCS